MSHFMAFISRYSILLLLGLIVAAAAIGVAMQGERPLDIYEAFGSEPRDNRAGAPATGLEQNPGRPQTQRPATQP